MGRTFGAKRGETSHSYSSTVLSLLVSGVMYLVVIKFIDTRPNKFV